MTVLLKSGRKMNWPKRKRYDFGGKGSRPYLILIEKGIDRKGKDTVLAEKGKVRFWSRRRSTFSGFNRKEKVTTLAENG